MEVREKETEKTRGRNSFPSSVTRHVSRFDEHTLVRTLPHGANTAARSVSRVSQILSALETSLRDQGFFTGPAVRRPVKYYFEQGIMIPAVGSG